MCQADVHCLRIQNSYENVSNEKKMEMDDTSNYPWRKIYYRIIKLCNENVLMQT